MMDFLSNIEFKDPWFLLLGLLPLGYFIWSLRKKGSPRALTVSSDRRMEDVSLIGKTGWLPDLLRLLSMLFLIVAIARPQTALQEETMKGEGIDIMLVMDLSGSMLAEDFKPNRLEVSKEVAKQFVDMRQFDRIGLTVFSKESFTQSPLTTDYEILKNYIDELQVGMLSDGTAIGMGLATSLNRLKDSPSASKIVILLTDGENNSGYIDPMTAVEIAKEYGIKVYTIGVGSDGNARMPVGKRGSIFSFGVQRTSIDEDLLTEMAEKTSGKYFRAIDKTSLQNIYKEIDRLEKSEIDLQSYKRYADHFRIFLWIGLMLLGIEILLRRIIYNAL